ncbi:hypothetical protein [Rhodococcus sp. IEGM 1408]|uniref:hypothetical protein n=1 Tax=Rhodococcus sp. IEGM 1408 TaxID=3082220 RepID=UPI002954C81A|nr:hypothetical protein [Rhodococcus sp. IEGM 1408]MDV8003173.1 hypothetical protein [Rhodococcus sp. IEGM 1408]
MPTQTPRRLVPIFVAATVAHRNERTVWRWLAAGHLTRYRSHATTLIDMDELEQMLAPLPATD